MMLIGDPEKRKHTEFLVKFFRSKNDVTKSQDMTEAASNVHKYTSNRDIQFLNREGKAFNKTAYCCFVDGTRVKCSFPNCKGFENKLKWDRGTFYNHMKRCQKKEYKFSEYNVVAFRMNRKKVQVMNVQQLAEHFKEERERQLKIVPSMYWTATAFHKWSMTIPGINGDDNFQTCADAAEFQAKFERTDQTSDWKKCFVVQDSSGLEMLCPDAEAILNMLELHDGDRQRRFIDVYAGTFPVATQKEFVNLFRKPVKERTAVFNNLDMEVSDIQEFKDAIGLPKFVRNRSMVNKLKLRSRPIVDRYILITQAGAFTDFHQDFGGTSVWFHMLRGKKTFFLVEPTEENIKKFEKSQEHATETDYWYGDKYGVNIRKVTLEAGQTYFMPGGWIHAVYTHEDAVVVAGSFFDEACISRQLRTFRVEEKTKAGDGNRVAEFLPIHFAYMEQKLLKAVKDCNNNRSDMRSSSDKKRIWERFQELYAFLDEFKKTGGEVTEETLKPSKKALDVQIGIQSRSI